MSCFGHLKALSMDIGPRGSTTASEHAAASYIAQEMQDLADEVQIDNFRSHTSFSWTYLILYAMSVVGAVLVISGVPAGAGPSALGLLLFILENDHHPTVSYLLPKRPSRNVIGVLRAASEARRKVVITAHYDSSRSAISFDPKRVKGFRMSFILMVVCMIAVALINTVYAIYPMTVFKWLVLPFALYLTGSILLLVHRELFGKYTAGANDNASGVAAMLDVLAHFSDHRLPETGLYFVATGCEEVGCVGMLDFLNRHGSTLREAFFINLDNVGAGQVKYTTAEGMIVEHPCDGELVELAEQVSKEHPEWNVVGVKNKVMSTDIGPVLVRGFRGISLRAEDENGLLPNWHWPTDVLENVEDETVELTANFTKELVTALSR